MRKIKVVGDPNNTESCSSEIIITNLNKGLKNLDLYSEDGDLVVYDCLANDHGQPAKYIICPYETAIPYVVFHNARNRVLIGVSNQNQTFYLEGGYPAEKTDVCLLGVDSKLWSPIQREPNKKFIFGMMCDSNTRAAYDELFTAFGRAFSGNRDVMLYIKDRWGTPQFKAYIKYITELLDITVCYDDDHITDKRKERILYNLLDCHVFLNRSSTFAMTVAQGMAMQKPTIVMDYSGPRDYCNHLNAFLVDFDLKEIKSEDLEILASRGYRNYLFTPNISSFRINPRWAVPNVDSLTGKLRQVYENEQLRRETAYYARGTAEALTWEKSAATLSAIVTKHENPSI